MTCKKNEWLKFKIKKIKKILVKRSILKINWNAIKIHGAYFFLKKKSIV